jgi:hypothetical protein
MRYYRENIEEDEVLIPAYEQDDKPMWDEEDECIN